MAISQCENCKRTVVGSWICDDCFPYFDGEKFLATPKEIGIEDENED